ncbi:MAG: DUF2062 domain-containing protein [Desulfobacterales bacterium]|jgi:uncharacterized protein (DUF2062 family)
MISRIKNRITGLIRAMLKEGVSLHKIALCLAVGVTLGIFPVLGMTTLLCTLAAFALRLNLPAIQLVNFVVYPVQLILLAPFYSAGSWLFNQGSNHVSGESLIFLLKNDFWGSMTSLWNLTLYAIFTWAVICPFIILILYMALKPAVAAVSSLRKKRL